MSTNRPALGATIYFMLLATLGLYFVFAAVQGDYGVFRQVQIRAETEQLELERDRLQAQLDVIENKTRRLSDEYLDLDLLDEQARDMLGFLRPDEIVIR
ncbi:FtsB family cell division protein [Falsirhodobacter halotolerans]|uniref:FtsB family cell division protein n=1 Tax=Falsirhodobacter halotolerans TaxID=1146892 RepID=UPI001FD5275A|nr:septum formation initiator family protein [Falsirhodobacter halotolerans]MCJ8139223.1 septum formation initiator family protein [Falsirhodobacter halotolerans]